MAASEGVWVKSADDLEETSTVLSLVAPSTAAAEAAAAASSSPKSETENHCYGEGLCPWCALGCSREEHGRLDKAAAKYHMVQARAASSPVPMTMSEENCVMHALRLMLLTCSMQVSTRGATDQEKATMLRLQQHAILPPTETWAAMGSAPPSPPGPPSAAAAAEEPAAGSSAKKRSKAKRQWWLDPPDAEWRKEPWTMHDTGRNRTIKVMGDKKEWIELPFQAVRQLLQWYDTSALFAEIRGVVTDLTRNHAYDYRIEGGKFLTQRNPNYPDSPPRECQVLYAGAVETESNW